MPGFHVYLWKSAFNQRESVFYEIYYRKKIGDGADI